MTFEISLRTFSSYISKKNVGEAGTGEIFRYIMFQRMQKRKLSPVKTDINAMHQ